MLIIYKYIWYSVYVFCINFRKERERETTQVRDGPPGRANDILLYTYKDIYLQNRILFIEGRSECAQVYWCVMDLLDGPAMDEVQQQGGPLPEISAIKARVLEGWVEGGEDGPRCRRSAPSRRVSVR